MDYSKRLQRVRQSMAARKLDAVVIRQPENRRYLSGYTATDHGIAETSGVLLILRKGPNYLLTDFRFREQAENETDAFEVLLYSDDMLKLLQKLLFDHKLNSLGFESDYTLHSSAENLFDLGRTLSVDMVPLTGFVEHMRLVKSEEEIDCIRRSVRLNEQVFQHVFGSLKDTATELDIALEIEAEMRRHGAEGAAFATIVASGAATSLPHAVPGRRELAKNAPVVIDMGLIHEGYCSDMTRSFAFGNADKKYTQLHRLVRQAQLAGMNAVRAGVSGREVDSAARQVLVNAGYGEYFGHALGHGVGIAVHEQPRVSSKNSKNLKPGMVITIEPGLYIPGWGGIRLENMVVVREDGCENLNSDTTWLDI